MGLADDLKIEINKIFAERWSTRDGLVVPSTEDLKLGSEAVNLKGTVLYADLASSTQLVAGYKNWFAAEIYKAFLYGSAKVIRTLDGVITGYDGDRIMAVYIGDLKNTHAATTALKINYLVKNIINPILKEHYSKTKYELRHVVGVDTSPLYVARSGIRGSNDLVWIGRAANYAAKLSNLSSNYPSRITKSVYDMLNDSAKLSSDGKPMWTSATWTNMGKMTIFRSTWSWRI